MRVRVYPFGEGKTEEMVFKVLCTQYPDLNNVNLNKFISVGGKNKFSEKIRKTLEADLIPDTEIQIVVFRDLDQGEVFDDVAQSFQGLAWILLSKWSLKPQIIVHSEKPNIYILQQQATPDTPGLRLVLHFPDDKIFDGLNVVMRNRTTDGYILALGLDETILRRFAGKIKCDDSTTSPDPNVLRDLINTAIPATVTSNGITFDQDKDFLAAYLCATRFWTVHRSEEQDKLAEVIMKRAATYKPELLKKMFQSWLDAIQMVAQ